MTIPPDVLTPQRDLAFVAELIIRVRKATKPATGQLWMQIYRDAGHALKNELPRLREALPPDQPELEPLELVEA